MAFQEGTGASSGFIVVSQSPDICLSPGAPIPYTIVGFLDQSIFTSGNVNFQSFPVFDMASRVTNVIGDEPGIGLGIVSGAVKGYCRPITPVPTVRCNGNLLCRHEHTLFEMNCLGPEGSGNTIGKVIYLGAMMCGPVGPNGALPAGSNEVLGAEAAGEAGALDKIKNSLSINSVEDAVKLSQRAFDLSQVDWSDPGGAIGAMAGMAGRAGLQDLGNALGMANTAMNNDWDDPVRALAGAASMAGSGLELGKRVMDQIEQPVFGSDEFDPSLPGSQTRPTVNDELIRKSETGREIVFATGKPGTLEYERTVELGRARDADVAHMDQIQSLDMAGNYGGPDLSGYDQVTIVGHGTSDIDNDGDLDIWHNPADGTRNQPSDAQSLASALAQGGFNGQQIETVVCNSGSNTTQSNQVSTSFSQELANATNTDVTGYPHNVSIDDGGQVLEHHGNKYIYIRTDPEPETVRPN